MLRLLLSIYVALLTAWLPNAAALPPGPLSQKAQLLRLDATKSVDIQSSPQKKINLATWLKTAARITYDDMKVAHVLSPVSGRIDKVLARPGDVLLAGQVLATIRSPDFATARADWHKAQVVMHAARRDLARQDKLYRRGAAPEQVVLAAWDIYRRALSEWHRAQTSLVILGGKAMTSDETYRLQSPISGVVVSRNVHQGMEVAGQYGGGSAQELFMVADLSQVWVVADVPEAEMGRVSAGADVTVQVDALPLTELTARLDYVADALDANVHTGRVRCVVPNATGRLKPDMYATLAIKTLGDMQLAVPKEALVALGGNTFVYVEHEAPQDPAGRLFERRHIIAEDVDADGFARVLRGLKEGERVVFHGGAALAALHEAQQ